MRSRADSRVESNTVPPGERDVNTVLSCPIDPGIEPLIDLYTDNLVAVLIITYAIYKKTRTLSPLPRCAHPATPAPGPRAAVRSRGSQGTCRKRTLHPLRRQARSPESCPEAIGTAGITTATPRVAPGSIIACMRPGAGPRSGDVTFPITALVRGDISVPVPAP